MSVRIIIVLLALPLFLLLAAVNSLLLYREDTADMEASLREQALAAAVTVAEFAKASPDPFADLAEPTRLAALRTGAKGIVGLDALYLIRPGGEPFNLLARPLAEPRRNDLPPNAQVLGTWHDSRGQPLITALAPAGAGAMVVADIDAEPLVRRAFHLKRMLIALIAGSATLAIMLGLFVARRVISEFRRTRAIIDGRAAQIGDARLEIREIRDLADAVHLIDASVASELERIGATGKRDPAIGIAAVRARHFPDVSESADGLRLSIRTAPNAPAGLFHIHRIHDGRCDIILGEIGGEPAAALAGAVAIKSHLLAGDPAQLVDRYLAAKEVFGVTRSVEAAGVTGPLALTGTLTTLRDYARRNPDLDPDALTADLAALFPDIGIVAVVKAA